MTKKFKSNVADLATKHDEKQAHLDDLLEEVAVDLQHMFNNIGADVRVDYRRNPKGEKQ